MMKLGFGRPMWRVSTAVLAVALAVSAACGGPADQPAPILVVSGPDDFTSFEIRREDGEAIWRLEADPPTPVGAFFYGKVPHGFLQVIPGAGEPRPLELGEEIEIESRISKRVFLHRGYADSDATIVILEWGMRRLETALD